jgi:hypothetical protein
MALANVAFLAAMRGQRVLIMDWDLEAPGLDFYFRGLSDQESARAIKTAPGVLDLVWTWRRKLFETKDPKSLDRVLEDYEAGGPFKACVRNILDPDRCPGLLHIIGAGSKVIEDDGPLPYAEALARFSWSEFFDLYGGGLFIERLRAWAKRDYDLILIDSRTGFADVAGVCTLQLPDTVALAFIYNRQNIEGVADVAASVFAARGEAVELRAVPMRTSRKGPIEEAEVRSRAVRALARSGAFTTERAQADIEHLTIRASPSVPFYETLAPFAAVPSNADELSLNYRTLARALFNDANIDLVEPPASWRDSVRQRLEPRIVTVDYIQGLETADPARAAEDLARLLEGAVETELYYGGVDDAYLRVLVDFAIDLESMVFDEVEDDEVRRLAEQALQLIRMRAEADPKRWNEAYVAVQERFDETFDLGVSDEDLLDRYAAYDALLAEAEPTAALHMRRADLTRRMAQLVGGVDVEAALYHFAAADMQLDLARKLGGEGAEVERARIALQRANLFLRARRPDDAKASALEGLRYYQTVPSTDGGRLGLALSLLLIRVEDNPEAAVEHIKLALEDESFVAAASGELSNIVKLISRSAQGEALALRLARRMAPGRHNRTPSTPGFFFGRSLLHATDFVAAAAQLAEIISVRGSEGASPAVEGLVLAVNSILTQLSRRPMQGAGRSSGPRVSRALLGHAAALLAMSDPLQVDPVLLSGLAEAIGNLDRALRDRPQE